MFVVCSSSVVKMADDAIEVMTEGEMWWQKRGGRSRLHAPCAIFLRELRLSLKLLKGKRGMSRNVEDVGERRAWFRREKKSVVEVSLQ